MRWNSSPGRRVTVDVKAIEARTSGAWFLVMLGSLTMLPPLSIDISLPGLPLIARTLGSPPALLQWTLSAFILAFGAGQLILGPLSDRYGRRPVLLWGLGLYALAGISCTLVNDARLLVALRLLQGFGACAGTVCARAVAQDLSTDRAGATFRQAILTSVNSFAPVIAPLLGAVILATLGWRALYGVLAVVGVVLVALVAVLLPETSPRIAHPVWGAYRRVLQLPRTLGLMLLVGGSFFGFFSLISGSPFALIAQLHLTSTQFAIAFAINSLSFIVAAALSARLVRTLDPEILFGSGVAFTLVATILAFVVALRVRRRVHHARCVRRAAQHRTQGCRPRRRTHRRNQHAGRRARRHAQRRALRTPDDDARPLRADRRYQRNRRVRTLEAGVTPAAARARSPGPRCLTTGAAAISRAPSRRRCGSRS
jgi:DHA1 family bicyclomycin/chloramphenicol resistance-like MFS transporter